MQSKVEPPSLDPAEEPLLWEGLTLNKCILVASVVALLSVTFQVLQGESGARTEREGAAVLPPPGSRPLLSSSAMLQGGNRPRPAGTSAPSHSRWVQRSVPPRSAGSGLRQGHIPGWGGPGTPCLGHPTQTASSSADGGLSLSPPRGRQPQGGGDPRGGDGPACAAAGEQRGGG